MKVSQGFVLSGIGRSRYSDHWVRITTVRRDGVMSHLIRALSGNTDRTEVFKDWLGMYVATLLVTSVLILLPRL